MGKSMKLSSDIMFVMVDLFRNLSTMNGKQFTETTPDVSPYLTVDQNSCFSKVLTRELCYCPIDFYGPRCEMYTPFRTEVIEMKYSDNL